MSSSKIRRANGSTKAEIPHVGEIRYWLSCLEADGKIMIIDRDLKTELTELIKNGGLSGQMEAFEMVGPETLVSKAPPPPQGSSSAHSTAAPSMRLPPGVESVYEWGTAPCRR